MSTALVSAKKTAHATSAAPPTLGCNLCQKPLATTCFLCACDCIFCEECTYSHFEQSSNCPTCGRVLTEQDFTELVVADASSTASSDIAKTSLQALFSKHSKSASTTKALPLSDLCFSLVKQIDVVKQSTKFILKQLLMESSTSNRRYGALKRSYDNLKNETTQLKQLHSSQRLQLEQVNTDLQNRLQAREQANADLSKKIKAQEKMLEQFRQMHHGMAVASTNAEGSQRNSSGGGRSQPIPVSAPGHRGAVGSRGIENQPPPLKGLIQQKEAQQQQQQQSYARRQPAIMGSRSISSQGQAMAGNLQPNMLGPRMGTGTSQAMGMRRGHSGGGVMAQHQQQPMVSRPFSSSSNGSLPSTPRIRDLSSSSGYNFTSSAAQGHHLNKRRRGTPHSSGGGMSPNTAFTLNQGPHSVGGSRWMQQSSRGNTGGYMQGSRR